MAAGDARLPTAHPGLLADNAGTFRALGVNADGMLYTHPWSNFGVTQDLLANDSDKTFTVPANHQWLVAWIMCRYAASATGGNRTLFLDILDAAANTLSRSSTNVDITANQTILILWSQGGLFTSDSSASILYSHIPNPLILPAGFQLRVYDLAAIDAAADDMEVTIGRQEIDDT